MRFTYLSKLAELKSIDVNKFLDIFFHILTEAFSHFHKSKTKKNEFCAVTKHFYLKKPEQIKTESDEV